MINLPDVELVAAKVHDSWMEAKREQGIFSWMPKGEELMVPYNQLSEEAKDLDRASVRAVYRAIEQANTKREMDLNEANRTYKSLAGRQ